MLLYYGTRHSVVIPAVKKERNTGD